MATLIHKEQDEDKKQKTNNNKKTNKQTNKNEKTQKNIAQYVLNITIRKQTQLTLINPPTNNWGYKGTEHRDGQHDTELRT